MSAFDPQRHFATAKCRIAKGLLAPTGPRRARPAGKLRAVLLVADTSWCGVDGRIANDVGNDANDPLRTSVAQICWVAT
jgi:hypothetical protein